MTKKDLAKAILERNSDKLKREDPYKTSMKEALKSFIAAVRDDDVDGAAEHLQDVLSLSNRE